MECHKNVSLQFSFTATQTNTHIRIHVCCVPFFYTPVLFHRVHTLIFKFPIHMDKINGSSAFVIPWDLCVQISQLILSSETTRPFYYQKLCKNNIHRTYIYMLWEILISIRLESYAVFRLRRSLRKEGKTSTVL